MLRPIVIVFLPGTLAAPAARIYDNNIQAYTLKPTWEQVANADFYEIEFNGMVYTTIKDNELLFNDLKPETAYSFKIRAVNKEGMSDWATFSATTKANPLEFAIMGIKSEATVASQGGSSGTNRLFDFDEGREWHTKYQTKAVPFDLIIDLVTVNQLDKFHYLPRTDASNGTFLKGTVSYSMDKEQWTDAGSFDWKRNNEVKIFTFANHPTARYMKIALTEGVEWGY